MRTTLMGLVLLTGCALPAPSEDPILQDALDALAATWGASAPDPDCHIDRAEVRIAALGPKVYGQLDWEKLGPGKRRPVIYVADWYHVESWLMLHELLHAYQDCSGGGSDGGHLDPDVWASAGGAGSIQERAAQWLKDRGLFVLD